MNSNDSEESTTDPREDLDLKSQPNPAVKQGEEIARRSEEGIATVNGGVGPQPDEHRGNAQGGFKYEGSEEKENVEEADGKRNTEQAKR